MRPWLLEQCTMSGARLARRCTTHQGGWSRAQTALSNVERCPTSNIVQHRVQITLGVVAVHWWPQPVFARRGWGLGVATAQHTVLHASTPWTRGLQLQRGWWCDVHTGGHGAYAKALDGQEGLLGGRQDDTSSWLMASRRER